MGTEEFWVPALTAALGAGVNQYENVQTARKQDEQAAQGIRIQSDKQQEANAQVGNAIQQVQQSTPDAQRAQVMNAFVSQLRANKANALGEGAPAGNTSARYKADTATAGQTVQDYGKQIATNEAGILAPQLQRQQEGQNQQQLATNLQQIGRQSQIDQFLNSLRIRGITPNPWVTAGGDILSGIGQGMAKNGGYKTKPGAINSTTGDSYDTSKLYTGNLA